MNCPAEVMQHRQEIINHYKVNGACANLVGNYTSTILRLLYKMEKIGSLC